MSFQWGNGGHIFCCELRVGCLFSTHFCTHYGNQTNLFLGAASAISSPVISQVSIAGIHFCIKSSQWKSCYVENVFLASALDMDIRLVVCGVTGISIVDYFLRETLV